MTVENRPLVLKIRPVDSGCITRTSERGQEPPSGGAGAYPFSASFRNAEARVKQSIRFESFAIV